MSYNFYGAKVVLFYILCKLNFYGDCFLPVTQINIISINKRFQPQKAPAKISEERNDVAQSSMPREKLIK